MLVGPRLLALSDTTLATPAQIALRFRALSRAAQPFSVALELRDRELAARPRLALGYELRDIARETQQYFAVNDRLDFAFLLGASLIHLAEGSVTSADARRLLGPTPFILRACHEISALRDFDADGALLSPVMAARKGRPPFGHAGLARARETLASGARNPALRLYALGGVTPENAAQCCAAGAFGVAVTGAALSASGPEPLLSALGILR